MDAKAHQPRSTLKQMPPETPEEKRQKLSLQTPSVLRTAFPHATAVPTFQASTPNTANQQPNGELLDYLRGRGGRIKELEDDLARSKAANDLLRIEVTDVRQAMRRMEGDLRTAQALAAAADARMHSSASSPQDTYTQQVEKLLDAELAKALDLEQQLVSLRQRLLAAEERASGAEASSHMMKAEADRAARASALQLAALQRECELTSAETSELVRKADRAAADAQARASAEADAHKRTAARLAEAEASSIAQASTAASLRQQLSAHLAKQASTVPPSSAALQQRVHDLETQLQQHKGTSTSTLSPMGEATAFFSSTSPASAAASGRGGAGAGGAVPDAEQLALPMVIRLRNELARAQAELSKWQQLLQTLPGVRGPEAALPVLQAQAAEVAEAKAALRMREEEGEALSARADATQAEVAALSEKVASTSAKLQTALADVAIAQRKLAVITQERNSLQRALREPPPNSGGGPQSIGVQLAAAQAIARAAQLESQVSTLQQDAEQMQADMSALARKEASLQGALGSACARAEAAEKRVSQLEKEADGLAREVGMLQEKLGRGEFSRSGSVRVLHLRMNPESEYQHQARGDELGILRAENTALKASVASLSTQLEGLAVAGGSAAAAAAAAAAPTPSDDPQGGLRAVGAGRAYGEEDEAGRPGMAAGGADSTGKGRAGGEGSAGGCGMSGGGGLAALVAKDAEIAVLQHKVGEADKAMVRLREVFKERAAAFREAVHLLFGYRVDMTSEATAARNAGSAPTTLSLRPQHFHEPDALLVFRLTRERGMELVPTSWTTGKLAREVDTFINKFKSIPAFTANLTMEGFQKATQC